MWYETSLLGAGGVAGVITAFGVAWLNWRTKKQQFVREDRQDDRKDRRDRRDDFTLLIENYRTEIVASNNRHDNVEKELRGYIEKIQKENLDCQVEQERLKGEVKLLQSSVQRLQSFTGDVAPGTTVPVVIIADTNGIMRHVSPSIGPMFHYTPNELIKKSIDLLMPERYRQAHKTGLETLKASGRIPWTEKVILGHGITKDGLEFPVAVSLSGWETDKGESLVAAEIRQRPSTLNEVKQEIIIAPL